MLPETTREESAFPRNATAEITEGTEGKIRNVSLTLSPLPQLFPRLDELLNLPCARKMVAGDPASEITTLIEIAHRGAREMREPMTQVFQVLPAQNFFRDLRTPDHDGGILACSLFVRLRRTHPLLPCHSERAPARRNLLLLLAVSFPQIRAQATHSTAEGERRNQSESPVETRLAASAPHSTPNDWPWSSFRHHVTDEDCAVGNRRIGAVHDVLIADLELYDPSRKMADFGMFFRHEQERLLEQLERRNAYLANIYVGGLRALADEKNPFCYQLAAHAFRELISHCYELTGARIVYGDGMKQRLKPVKKAFAAMKRARTPTANSSVDSSGLSTALNQALEEFLVWEESNRAEARKKVARLLTQLSGGGPALPSDVIADDISGWMDSYGYFKGVAHDGRAAKREEFIQKLFVVENVLLRHMRPRPVSDLDEIDALIREGEDGY
jgi:hypothetical protein